MRRAVIFGAGQCGRWLLRILSGAGIEVVGFADNDEKKAGGLFEGLPVCLPRSLAGASLDVIFIAMKGAERVASAREQLSRLGIAPGAIEAPPAFLTEFDARVAELGLAAERIRELGIPGAAAELGVYRGDFAARINAALPDRSLYLFDTFEGFSAGDVEIERKRGCSAAREGDFSDTDEETVRSKLPHPERAIFMRGVFPESALGLEEKFCLVSIDADLYAPVYEGLRYFYPRMSPGGAILLHDHDSVRFRGAGEAARQFCAEHGIRVRPLWDMHGSAVLEISNVSEKNAAGHTAPD